VSSSAPPLCHRLHTPISCTQEVPPGKTPQIFSHLAERRDRTQSVRSCRQNMQGLSSEEGRHTTTKAFALDVHVVSCVEWGCGRTSAASENSPHLTHVYPSHLPGQSCFPNASRAERWATVRAGDRRNTPGPCSLATDLDELLQSSDGCIRGQVGKMNSAAIQRLDNQFGRRHACLPTTAVTASSFGRFFGAQILGELR